MLEMEGITASYGEARVLTDVSLSVGDGEAVTLVGRNGAGKTTLLRCLMGLHKRAGGRITFCGQEITKLPPHRRARLGMGYVPDDRGIYASLTVEENLTLSPVVGPAPWSLDRIYEAFPVLADRRRGAASRLSGGEQQMLALARCLRMGSRMLLCDEPTEGLAPIIVQQIGEILRSVVADGVSVLLVEQNLHFATTVAHRHLLLAEGRIVERLDNSDVRERRRELLRYLGV